MSQMCIVHLRDDEHVPATRLHDGDAVCDDCATVLGGETTPLTGGPDRKPVDQPDEQKRAYKRCLFGKLIPDDVRQKIVEADPTIHPDVLAERFKVSDTTVRNIRKQAGIDLKMGRKKAWTCALKAKRDTDNRRREARGEQPLPTFDGVQPEPAKDDSERIDLSIPFHLTHQRADAILTNLKLDQKAAIVKQLLLERWAEL